MRKYYFKFYCHKLRSAAVLCFKDHRRDSPRHESFDWRRARRNERVLGFEDE